MKILGMGLQIKAYNLVFIGFLGLTSCAFVSDRMDERRHREALENKEGSPAVTYDEDQLIHLRIRDAEKRLSTRREKEHYTKLLPWFRDEKERLEYLSIDGIHAKQEWALDNKIWIRAKNPNQEMKDMMQSGDIAIGMPMDYVTKSWGEPLAKEISGNPIYRNEKWRYSRSLSTQDGYKQEKRIVYFEGGRVVGWETE